MRTVFFIALLVSFQIFPVYAGAPCNETRTTASKIYNKIVSSFDTVVPILFHDPERSIQFHLSRSKKLYVMAKDAAAKSYTGDAIRLATLAEHHLTLLEADIRQIQNPDDVPFDQIFAALENTSLVQADLLAALPPPCTRPVTQLQSFEMRTDAMMKKLYYESLLP